MLFQNRKIAGQLLSSALLASHFEKSNVIVLGLPRGGVLVAKEIAETLEVPLSVCITRKISLPENPEFAIAAIDEDGILTGDADKLSFFDSHVAEEVIKQKKEIKRRLNLYLGKETHPSVKSRDVLLVDDGIATGQTMIAAINFIKRKGARRVYVAVPVLPADTIDEIKERADGLFYLYAPESFWAVGEFYRDFPQITDSEVRKTLNNKSILKNNLAFTR